MTDEHGLPIVRACQVARLSWPAYYKPGIDWAARDGEVIAALAMWNVGIAFVVGSALYIVARRGWLTL